MSEFAGPNVKGRKAVVFGLGRSGEATIRLLVERGAQVRASDLKPLAEMPRAAEELDALNVPFVPQSAAAVEDRDLIILSPGVRPDLPFLIDAQRRGAELTGDMEFASRYLRGPIIGITGSNGKTTTTALVGHLLQDAGLECQVGGNIGKPLADMLESSKDNQWNVLEISSYQAEMLSTMRVRIAAALNVTPDHLDRHGSFQRYWEAKAGIFRAQTPEDSAVLNAENEPAVQYKEKTQAEVHWFNAGGKVDRGFWMEGTELIADGTPWMPASEIHLRGRHNIENVLAAGCVAHLAGAPLDSLRRGVASFPGVEHRIEFTRTVNGVSYFNDSKATNVDATVKAIESFERGLWVILGGKDKNSDYTTLRPLLQQRAKAALLIGAAAEKIEQHLKGSIRLEQCGTLEAAIRLAHAEAQTGDTVLLAPACASFDQFQSYEHRGRVFKDLVNTLEEK